MLMPCVSNKRASVVDITVFVQLSDKAFLPEYKTEEAAGADLRACLTEPLCIEPMQRQLIPTGIRVALPFGFEMQVRPRSGLALKHGITVLNSPGTVDSDYRGELGVLLVNFGDTPFVVNHGDRIAQVVIAPVVRADFSIADILPETARGEGGYGSTGIE